MILDNISQGIAAGATVSTMWLDVTAIDAVRIVVSGIGIDTVVRLEGKELGTYVVKEWPSGQTGTYEVVDIRPDKNIRVSATNNGAAIEQVANIELLGATI